MAVFTPQAITSSGESFGAKHYLKLAIACVSYANLCFINVWAEMLDRSDDFFRNYSISWHRVAGVTLDILLLAAIVFAALSLAIHSPNRRYLRLMKWLGLAGLLLPVNIVRTDWVFASVRQSFLWNISTLRMVFVVAAVIGGVLLLVNWERFSSRLTGTLLIILAPSLPLSIASTAWRVESGPPGGRYAEMPRQAFLPQAANQPHVIWLIFDEWDPALTFQDRPSGLMLPEVDRFREASFFASRVYPPSHATIVSVPSMLSGKTFIESSPKSSGELMLTYTPGTAAVPLSGQRTIFAEARSRGFNVGISGWYLPYCRIMPQCSVCSWSSAIGGLSSREEAEFPSVARTMLRTFERQIRVIPLLYRAGVSFGEPLKKSLGATAYQRVLDGMLPVVIDPRLNLVFIHMSIPHPPAIYLASRDAMSTADSTTYVDNLRLVDRTIYELRQALEKAGMWDTSTILLTADHPLRVANWPTDTLSHEPLKQQHNVPYMLKLAGQKQGYSYNAPVQEIVTKDLLLAILNRKIQSTDEVAAWMEHNPPHQ